MQTPDNPDYYLKHGFDKAYSNYGVPYIDEGCAPGLSNNIVIYGHHMNDGTMFADLCGYADRGFYEGHKTIPFIKWMQACVSTIYNTTAAVLQPLFCNFVRIGICHKSRMLF